MLGLVSFIPLFGSAVRHASVPTATDVLLPLATSRSVGRMMTQGTGPGCARKWQSALPLPTRDPKTHGATLSPTLLRSGLLRTRRSLRLATLTCRP
jgi:hypothetical protein